MEKTANLLTSLTKAKSMTPQTVTYGVTASTWDYMKQEKTSLKNWNLRLTEKKSWKE